MANPPTFVPGIHYFCDHRCWRCSLTDRCAVFDRLRQSPPRNRKTQTPTSRVAAALAASLEVTMEDATVMMASGVVPQSHAPIGPVETEPPSHDRLKEFAEHDSLVTCGAEYGQGTWRVLKALRPVLAKRGDAAAIDAAERLEETCLTVASKIFRAVSSSLDADYDAADIQSDSNGSAKVALLLIEESRQAWQILMQPGRAAADGVPARQVAALDGLETELLRRFPRALEFVRPGFDTGQASGANGQLATAILAAGRPAGTA
jgi:hypothetical protein